MKVIVGDKFVSFTENTNNICFTDFVKNPQPYRNTTMITGLGLSKEELFIILEIATSNNIELLYNDLPAPCSFTHKKRVENCLISIPNEVEEGVYESHLILDDNAELLLDHITGLHIQGMVLIEACRQMFIAVATCYFSHHAFAKERYGAINHMNCNFHSFAFPLPATIRYTRKSAIANQEDENIAFCADIEIIQAGRTVFSMSMEHTYYNSRKITSIESYKAASACNRLFETV